MNKQGKLKRPPKNSGYPTKQQLALRLLEQFAQGASPFQIKAILTDALYRTAKFMAQADEFFAKAQVISQLHCNQTVLFRSQNWRVDRYFRAYGGVSQPLHIRDADETDCRYWVVSDLGWRTLDVAQAYTLRWIVKVAIAGLKIQEGRLHREMIKYAYAYA